MYGQKGHFALNLFAIVCSNLGVKLDIEIQMFNIFIAWN